MNMQKTAESLRDVAGFLNDLSNHMVNLADAIEEEREDEIQDLMDDLPPAKTITKNLTLLGKLLNTIAPKKAKRHAG